MERKEQLVVRDPQAKPDQSLASAPGLPREEMADRSSVRRLPSCEELPVDAATVQWMDRLPQHLRPVVTSRRHPHVVKRLCMDWQRPMHMRAHFWDLLIDQRGNRRGFSFEVFCELSALQDHYLSLLSREQRAVWNAGKTPA